MSRKQFPWQRPSRLSPRQLAISSQSPPHRQAGWILTKNVKINIFKNCFVWDPFLLLLLSQTANFFAKKAAHVEGLIQKSRLLNRRGITEEQFISRDKRLAAVRRNAQKHVEVLWSYRAAFQHTCLRVFHNNFPSPVET